MSKFLRNQRGQGLTEYAILLVLVAMSCLMIVKSIGTQLKGKLTSVRNKINSEITIAN